MALIHYIHRLFQRYSSLNQSLRGLVSKRSFSLGHFRIQLINSFKVLPASLHIPSVVTKIFAPLISRCIKP